MRRRAKPFVEYGYGNDVVERLDERWQQQVLADHALWSQYGHPPFDLRDLPRPQYRAHLAILEGQSQRRQDDADEAEREAKRAQRQSRRR